MSLLQSIFRRNTTQRVQATLPQRPVPLQPAELKSVVGGSPRGTWNVAQESLTTSTDASPRGTW